MNFKKLLLFIIALTINCTGAFAKTYEVNTDKNAKKLVIAKYQNNILSDVECIELDSDKDSFEFTATDDNFKAFLIYNDKIEKTYAQLKTENNNKTDEKKEQTDIYEQKYPDLYEKEKDANRAIIVVDSVAYKYENNENYVAVKAMYLGEEREFLISDDVELEYVPESYNDLAGAKLSALKRGDIIKLSSSFSGNIEKASLIFRPPVKNPVLSEADSENGFLNLFSANGIVAGDSTYKASTSDSGINQKGYGYAFGVIKEYKNFTLELSDADGDILEAEIADGAHVYICDAEEKFKLSRGNNSTIRKGAGSKSAFSEDGEFLSWNEDKDLNFAFIRTISGVATEVVIYKNY